MYPCAVPLYPFWLTSSCFSTLYAFFSVFGFCQDIPSHACRHSAALAWLCTHWDEPNLSLEKTIFENQQAVQDCLLPRVLYHEIHPKRLLSWCPGLWSWYVLFFLSLRTLNSTTHSHCSQAYLRPLHSISVCFQKSMLYIMMFDRSILLPEICSPLSFKFKCLFLLHL